MTGAILAGGISRWTRAILPSGTPLFFTIFDARCEYILHRKIEIAVRKRLVVQREVLPFLGIGNEAARAHRIRQKLCGCRACCADLRRSALERYDSRSKCVPMSSSSPPGKPDQRQIDGRAARMARASTQIKPSPKQCAFVDVGIEFGLGTLVRIARPAHEMCARPRVPAGSNRTPSVRDFAAARSRCTAASAAAACRAIRMQTGAS